MADVTSANVVGYYGDDATKGAQKLTMTGVAMTDVAGGALNLNAGFNVDGITGADGVGRADNILVWDPTKAGGAGGYLTFYFYDDGDESGWTGPDEYYVDDSESAYKNFFVDGVGFWFRAYDNKDKKITFSGAVDNNPYVEPALASGKQQSFVVNPFPTTINFNDAKQFSQNGVTGADGIGRADNIYVWDPTKAGGAGGYLTFYFYDDGDESGWTAPDEYYIGDPECAYNDFFKPGKAFWFKPVDAKEKTLRFLNPITK